jgi:stress-induced morphogen
MPIDTTAIEKAIKRAIPVTHLEIEDQSRGCGDSYAIVLVSEVSSHSKLFRGITNFKLSGL